MFTLKFSLKNFIFFNLNQIHIEMQIFYLHSGANFKLSRIIS